MGMAYFAIISPGQFLSNLQLYNIPERAAEVVYVAS